MKLIVLAEFHDINNYSVIYRKGQEVDFDDPDRVESLIKRGLCESITEPVMESETEPVVESENEDAESEQKQQKRGRKSGK